VETLCRLPKLPHFFWKSTLHHTATHCTTLQRIAPHCNALQHTARYRNTPQHTAIYHVFGTIAYFCIRSYFDRADLIFFGLVCVYRYIRAHILKSILWYFKKLGLCRSKERCLVVGVEKGVFVCVYVHPCQTRHHTAAHCNTKKTLFSHWTRCSTLQHTATHCNTLQHTATHCNTLQHTATRNREMCVCLYASMFVFSHVWSNIQLGEWPVVKKNKWLSVWKRGCLCVSICVYTNLLKHGSPI